MRAHGLPGGVTTNGQERDMDQQKDFWAGIALAFTAALLWSGNYIVARGIHAQISPVSLAFFRWLTATLFLFPFAFRKVRQQWQLVKVHVRFLAVVALLGVSIFNTLIYVAGHYASAMNLAIIGTSAAPIFVLVLSRIFLREKITGLQVAGTLICVVGILILISKGSFDRLGAFRLSAGDVWILLAALSFAVYTILVRRKPRELAALTFLFATFLLGTLFLLPAFVIDSLQGLTFSPKPNLVLVFLYLGIGASAGAFLSWNLAIQKIGPVKTALFGNLIPIFSTIEAVLILGEDNSRVVVVSIVTILLGLLLANAGQLKRRS